MQYLGGKFTIRKVLSAYLQSRLNPGDLFVEPFCGGLNITQEISGNRIASDYSESLIVMYKALQGGWATPSQVTKEDYYACKARADLKDPLTGFIGYCCSYGGKFWGGYAAANPKNPHGYARNGANSLARTFANCPSSTVIFNHGSYETLDFGKRSLIYCDPPYEGTTGYDATGAFNHDAFWEWCRKRKAAGATVLISSYKARPDFKVVFQVTKKTTLGKIEDSQECLFEPQ